MAVGKRRTRQDEFWVAADQIARTPGHPFYQRLGTLLTERAFDRFCEKVCGKFYAEVMGRPSLAPGVYFRTLLIGYFEGLDSERGIAWRCADSLSLKSFLGCGPTESTADHSTISRTRRLIDLETHREVFAWILKLLAEHGLLKGDHVGIDASTMEANAAMRSIVRKDTGETYQPVAEVFRGVPTPRFCWEMWASIRPELTFATGCYQQFLEGLAKASGIETPTQADLIALDRKRKDKSASNEDWKNPHDPDAKIAKMKDGRTHFAYKNEHAVDLETGAVIAAEIHPADQGDTTTGLNTLAAASESLRELSESSESAKELGQSSESAKGRSECVEVSHTVATHAVLEAVADKGYHSNETLVALEELGIRGYIAEPDHGRRKWQGKSEEESAEKSAARDAVYRNRRRIRGAYSKALHRKRGELVERAFAHILDTGGMRRAWLRGRENLHKRYLIHVAAFNLSLVMRKLLGFGTPRELAAAFLHILRVCLAVLRHQVVCTTPAPYPCAA